MDFLTRREVLAAVAAGCAATFAIGPTAKADPPESHAVSLAAAIQAFNERAQQSPIGKIQPPLTEEEVIAALRWIDMERKEPGVTEPDYELLRKIVETRELPAGVE